MTVDSLYFEITNTCNLNCSTCYNRSGLTKELRELPVENIRQTILFFRSFGLKRVLFSGGEPSLHSHFKEMLSLADEFPELSFGITTNGTLSHAVLLSFLLHHQNSTLQISLDGSSDAVNSKNRSADSFYIVQELIALISNAGIAQKRLRLKAVLTQNNLDDVEAYFNMAIKNGFLPDFEPVQKSGNAISSWNDLALNDFQVRQAVRAIEKCNQKHGTNVRLPLACNSCPYVENKGEYSFAISSDGSIYPCQSLINTQYTIGNINHLSEEALWANINQLTNLASKRLHVDYGCSRCLLSKYCGRGCMALALQRNNDILAPDGNCALRRSQVIEFSLLKK